MNKSLMRLEGKVALITGAAQGVGKGIAEVFAHEGAVVVIADLQEKKGQAVADSLDGRGVFIHTDLRQDSDIEQMIASTVKQYGALDILINNAGNAHGMDFIHEGDIEDWDMMIDTNVKGLLYVSKEVLKIMVKNNRGHIINIGSIAGKEVYPKGNIYCASKFAVDAISQGMRIDLNKHNIKVSQINPGLVETNFSMVRFKDDQERSKSVYKDVKPLVSEDIANVIDYVISSPENVNISDITVLAKSQASSTVINRG